MGRWVTRATGGLVVVVAATSVSSAQPATSRASVPVHPRDLIYPPLSFTPPAAVTYRQVLSNGVVAYMVEDHDLPLITVTLLIKGGSYLDPHGKEGLAGFVGSQMRSGGAGAYSAEQFDEELDYLAASVSSAFGPTSGSATADFLAKDTDRVLALFFDMVRSPRFDTDRLELARTQTLQGLERRNDSTDDIEGREWARLMRGDAHFSTAPVTKASVDGITRDDLVRFHQQHVHPGNVIVAVSGDFQTAAMKARLEQAMAGWTKGTPAPDVPKPQHTPVAGVYLVNKPDVNQGRVSIGHLGIVRGNPDEVTVDLMNDILGGSGFTSRITNRVRTDEGLAYSAGSSLSAGVHYEGTFRASFQSKSASCARAAGIVLDEIGRIRREPVSAEELDTVKNSAIETFPRIFSSASAVARTLADDEQTGRDPTFWATYRDRVRAVTVQDIQRVAAEYLQPDRLVILAVGNVDEMLEGDPDRPEYSFEKLAKGAPMTRIPLPDPATMVYPR